MENDPENDNAFLSHWLEGKISDDELRNLVGNADFAAYEKLNRSIGKLQIEDPEMERNYAAIKAKKIRGLKPSPNRAIPIYIYTAIAAAALFLFGLFQFFVSSNHVETGVGKSSVAMADGSLIRLNSKSTIEYPSLFKYNRKVCLDGEAYFEVEKGRSFLVKTSSGSVEVLGTKFNVIARADYFEVVCFEGKVKVSIGKESTIITKGNAIRFYKNRIELWNEVAETQPLWLSGESGFRNAPLQIVIAQLQLQYNLQVAYPKSLAGTRFTGSFTHQNIDTALQTICIPLNLKYHKTEAGKIIISK